MTSRGTVWVFSPAPRPRRAANFSKEGQACQQVAENFRGVPQKTGSASYVTWCVTKYSSGVKRHIFSLENAFLESEDKSLQGLYFRGRNTHSVDRNQPNTLLTRHGALRIPDVSLIENVHSKRSAGARACEQIRSSLAQEANS